jgi:hypothetical protein
MKAVLIDFRSGWLNRFPNHTGNQGKFTDLDGTLFTGGM